MATQTTVTCGLPSVFSVVRWASGPVATSVRTDSGITMAPRPHVVKLTGLGTSPWGCARSEHLAMTLPMGVMSGSPRGAPGHKAAPSGEIRHCSEGRAGEQTPQSRDQVSRLVNGVIPEDVRASGVKRREGLGTTRRCVANLADALAREEQVL